MFQFIKKLGSNIKGFTLFELLIIIFVITLIAGSASYFFGSAREEARDFQRISDIESIQNALGLYFVDQGYYPEAITEGQPIVSPDGNVTYLAEVPVAPAVPDPAVDTEGYNYVRAASTTSYTIDYYLAGEAGGQGNQGGSVAMVYSGNCTATPDTACEGQAQCVPNCTGKVCGDDGCGGSCGTCDGGYECSGGSCAVQCNERTFNGGLGTVGSPYQICSCQQLQNMTTNLSAYYTLIRDVDCSATSGWSGGSGFLPVGYVIVVDGNDNHDNAFVGVFDGAGYEIDSLFINRPTGSNTNGGGIGCGIFGNARYATIKNVGMTNVNITCYSSIGAIFGMGFNTDVSKVYAESGSVASSYNGSLGGLIGSATRSSSPPSSAKIANSYSKVSVTLNKTSNTWYVGGLVGYVGMPIENCYATGAVVGTATSSATGGLVGTLQGSTISNSFSTGMITASGTYKGGLIGYGSSISGSYWNNLGGNSALTCYYDGNVTPAAGDTGCTKVSNTAATNLTHFYSSSNAPMSSWNFDTIWQETATYPTLIF